MASLRYLNTSYYLWIVDVDQCLSDVQANVYCQISGSKHMILFPPSDVNRLSFAPGVSSSSMDVFESLHSPELGATHPWEANLHPGDILYLPPLVCLFLSFCAPRGLFRAVSLRRLTNIEIFQTVFIPLLTLNQWLHTAAPTTETSIAVNVFFRTLEPSQYSRGRDVYGNRDLAAYEKGRQEISRIATAFDKAPSACKQFYLLRLAEELAQKAKDP